MKRRPPKGRYATSRMKRAVLKRDGYECRYCGRPVTMDTANADHVIPWKDGGKTELGNLVTACHNCNKAKGNKSAAEYAELVKATT